MAKQLLTKKIVAETKALLERDGAEVTAKAIRDRAGVGSYSTATRLLDELRADETALLSMPDDVANEYSWFKDFIWTTAMSHATQIFEADRMLLERDRDNAEALARERLNVINEMEADAATQAKRMAQKEERLRAAKSAMTDMKRHAEAERMRAETLQTVIASMVGDRGADSAPKDASA